MKRVFHLLLLLVLLAFSCKKKELGVVPDPVPINNPIVYDTIKPNSYLPVFPGSWWKYLDSENDTIMENVSSTYHLNWYTFVTTSVYRSDTFLVPVYKGLPIWGYRANHGPQSYSNEHPLKLVVTDSLPVGATWLSEKKDSHSGTKSFIQAKDTSITIFGITYYPTIVVASHEFYDTQNFPVDRWNYYTKDIGLIKTEGKEKKYLISFHIND